MQASQTTARSPLESRKLYTTPQLLAMDEEKLKAAVLRDFNSLVAIAIADATNLTTPPHVRRFLRTEEWCRRWLDAIKCAEGSLACDLERMRFLGDERASRTEERLRGVRIRKVEAGKLLSRFRSQRDDSSQEVERTALMWLRQALPVDFERHMAAVIAMGPTQPPQGEDATKKASDGELAAEAWRRGLIREPVTDSLRELLKLDDEAFADAVATDARHQNGRNHDLRHPFALSRWRDAIVELLEVTVPLAAAQNPLVLGPLKVDLWELPEERARKILNARRFFAGLLQRRAECELLIGDLRDLLGNAEPTAAAAWWGAARSSAMRLLAEEQPAVIDFIRNTLRQYSMPDDDTHLDPALLPSSERGQLKRRVLAAARAEDLTPLSAQSSMSSLPLANASIYARTAHALASMGMSLCHRRTIRALLPRGSAATEAFSQALSRLESLGLVERGQEFVRVVDQERMQAVSTSEIAGTDGALLDLNTALAEVEREIKDASAMQPRTWIEQRTRELDSLRRLMSARPVSGSTRVVLRTGRDDRLDAGEYRPAAGKPSAAAPVKARRNEAKPACSRCHGQPPTGFTCRSCGADGVETWTAR